MEQTKTFLPWQNELALVADAIGVNTNPTRDMAPWNALVTHVKDQRMAAQQELSLHEVKLQVKSGVTDGDILVLRTGSNPPEALRPVAQQLFDSLAEQGKKTLVVITPMGLDNLRPKDAQALLAEIAAELPDEHDQPPAASSNPNEQQGELFPPESPEHYDTGVKPTEVSYGCDTNRSP